MKRKQRYRLIGAKFVKIKVNAKQSVHKDNQA